MKKLSIDNLIEFRRRKSDGSRFTFLNNTQKEKEKKPGETGGHYWVCCLSTASNVFKTDDKNLLNQKSDELREWIEETDHEVTKIRWQQNINILSNLEDYDFQNIKPSGLKFLKKSIEKASLTINDVLVESNPHHAFSFTEKDFEEVGAVWFIAKKGGFKKSELAMFCDIMYRHLTAVFGDKLKISSKYCVAVDLFNCQDVNYSQLLDGEINYLLDNTINDVKAALAKLNNR